MKPTKDFILEAAKRLEEFYNQRNVNIRVWREIALLTRDSYWVDSEGNYKPPEDREVRLILPIAHSVIESYLALMLTRPPVISVPSSDIRQIHQTQANNIEKMLYAIWSKTKMTSVVRDALWHALVGGWGTIQVCYDPEADLQDKCPIYARSVDPIGFYPMPSARQGEWEYVVLSEHRLVGDLRNTFVLGKDGRRKAVKTAKSVLDDFDDTDRVKIMEYWDAEWHAFMIMPEKDMAEEPSIVEGEWLLPPVGHDFKRIPFVTFFGQALPFRDRGERMGVSVLFPLEQLIRYVCQLVSQKASIIARYANPAIVTKTAEGRGFEIPPEPFGGQIPLEIQESAEFLLPPGTSPSVDMQLEQILGQLEQAGLPRHIMGQITVGGMSGIAMNLLRTPVLMKVAFKQMSAEEALEDVNELFLRAIENYVISPVYMWGHDSRGQAIEVALDPAEIGGYYRSQVKLSASLPTDETAVTAMLTALKQVGVLSGRTVRDVIQQTLRDMVTQSLDTEEDQILIEKLLAMPDIQMALAQDAAREAGIQLPTQQQAGMPGGQGQIPGMPMQGAIPGMPGGAMAPQQMPWTMQGRGQPTTPDMIRRMAQQVAGAQGGAPGGLGMPGAGITPAALPEEMAY